MERHVRVSFLKVAIIKGPAKLLLRKFSFKIEVSVVLQITGHSKNGPLNRRNDFFFKTTDILSSDVADRRGKKLTFSRRNAKTLTVKRKWRQRTETEKKTTSRFVLTSLILILRHFGTSLHTMSYYVLTFCRYWWMRHWKTSVQSKLQ